MCADKSGLKGLWPSVRGGGRVDASRRPAPRRPRGATL